MSWDCVGWSTLYPVYCVQCIHGYICSHITVLVGFTFPLKLFDNYLKNPTEKNPLRYSRYNLLLGIIKDLNITSLSILIVFLNLDYLDHDIILFRQAWACIWIQFRAEFPRTFSYISCLDVGGNCLHGVLRMK